MQDFDTVDLVRLEVQQGWPDLPNLVPNPNGDNGSWGWLIGDAFTVVDGAGDYLEIASPSVATISTVTEWIEIPPAVGSMQIRAAVSWLVSPGTAEFQLGVITNLGTLASVDRTTVGGLDTGAVTVPPGVTRLRLGVIVDNLTPAGPWSARFSDAVLMYGTPTEIAASDPLTETPWTNVLGSAHDTTIERDELDQGTLSATIYDAALDPATNELIRPGKRCRCLVLVDDVWEPIFTGTLADPSVAYLVKDPTLPDGKRTEVKLLAHDAASLLANSPRPNGVGTIPDLPAVLLGAGVPWNVNGSTAAIDPASTITVAVNESASALDQLAITRDSVLGYVWVDRAGVVQAWDAGLIPSSIVASYDEGDYSDLGVDFDLGRLINSVKVKVVRINPGTGETEEVEYGPFENASSIREWDPRRAEFRVQGIDEALVDDYATAILTANATPGKRINEVTLPLRTVAEVEANALVDLYDLVECSNARAEIVDQAARVTTVKHSITADPRLGGKWLMTLGFSSDGSVAVPQVTPSPTVGGQRTLAELLRPVGEVTMWFGAKADIPAGWLPLDGSMFSGTDYPVLAALLGGTTLPSLTDRFPIGAGTKALGTSGGSAVASLTIPNMPDGWGAITSGGYGLTVTAAHANTVLRRGLSAAGGAAGASTPFSVLNPWSALWFIIRAA